MDQTILEQFRNADVRTCDPEKLADLRDIIIDTALPRSSRMDAFLRQVRNPYLFRAEGLVIKAVYPADAGRKLADVLQNC